MINRKSLTEKGKSGFRITLNRSTECPDERTSKIGKDVIDETRMLPTKTLARANKGDDAFTTIFICL